MKRKKPILKVTDAFENPENWKKDHLLIRQEAYKSGVKYPVVLASVNTKIAYVFEGAKVPDNDSGKPSLA